MGRVLLAHDPVLDRDVALKHLRADLAIPDETRRGLVTRMRHEARAAARVMHPHLVTLHDMGEDERVGLYLVFEYVEGPTLKQRIAEGAMPAADAAKIADQLGSALTTAHEAGILHRDIKPENVILSKKGAKVADFGIAKIPDSTLTHQGGLMGTPAYSAPETFRTSTFSPESDQFSLAATLYEAVSGRRAFPGDDAVAVAQHILHERAAPFAEAAGLPEMVDQVFARALSRKPRERFPSCEAFGRALSAALTPTGGTAGSAPPGGAEPALTPPPATGITAASDLPAERKHSHIFLGVIAVVVTSALLVRTALKSTEEPPPPAASAASAGAPTATAASSARPRPTAKTSSRPTASSGTATPPDAGASPSESGSPDDAPAPTVTGEPSSSAGPSPLASPTGSAAASDSGPVGAGPAPTSPSTKPD